MKKTPNVIEYGPGDITYHYNDTPHYRLHQPQSPILEMWTNQYEIFEKKVGKELNNMFDILIVSGCIANVFALRSKIISNIIIFAATARLIYSGFCLYNFSQMNKFKYAIIWYEELKKYEEMYPEEKSIFDNENLKGISKRKLEKRVNVVC